MASHERSLASEDIPGAHTARVVGVVGLSGMPALAHLLPYRTFQSLVHVRARRAALCQQRGGWRGSV